MENLEPKIIDCICCWNDLLGYGKPFMDANWNLNEEGCKSNYARIQNVRHLFIGSYSMCKSGTKMVINDGFANSIDVDIASPDSFREVLLFLEGAISDYVAINYADKNKGFPGVRGVISSGHRFSYDQHNRSIDLPSNRCMAYYPIEFQMNTAFSKANIIEGSGKRAGLKGSNLFFDRSVFALLKRASSLLGITPPQIIQCNDSLLVQVYSENGWFADLFVDPIAISYGKSELYDHHGINTNLYRFIRMGSIIDDVCFEASFQQAARIAKIDEE